MTRGKLFSIILSLGIILGLGVWVVKATPATASYLTANQSDAVLEVPNPSGSSDYYDRPPVHMRYWQSPNLLWTFSELRWSGWGEPIAKASGHYKLFDGSQRTTIAGSIQIQLSSLRAYRCGDAATPTYFYTRVTLSQPAKPRQTVRALIGC